MKKMISLMAIFLAGTLAMMAQSSLVATLTKGTETTSYYGIDAFKEAVAAATDGHLITLSEGTFNAPVLNKALTIRGAGSADDRNTSITGEVRIQPSENATTPHRLAIYGVYFKDRLLVKTDVVKNLFLEKCTLPSFESNEGTVQMMSVVQCRVTNQFIIGNESSVSAINSIISRPYNYWPDKAYFNFQNCILLSRDSPVHLKSMHLNKSIWVFNSSTNTENCILPSNNSIKNSIVTGSLSYPHAVFNAISAHTGQWMPIEKVFKTVPTAYNVYDATNDYHLTETLAAEYEGDTNGEIGIYGGVAPFTSVVSYPHFTKFIVDPKTSEDGKLKVEVEVSDGE